MAKETKPDWIAIMSFSAIQNDNPEFQEVLTANVERWRDEAEKLRLQLPTWADTARIVAAALPAGASTVG